MEQLGLRRLEASAVGRGSEGLPARWVCVSSRERDKNAQRCTRRPQDFRGRKARAVQALGKRGQGLGGSLDPLLFIL